MSRRASAGRSVVVAPEHHEGDVRAPVLELVVHLEEGAGHGLLSRPPDAELGMHDHGLVQLEGLVVLAEAAVVLGGGRQAVPELARARRRAQAHVHLVEEATAVRLEDDGALATRDLLDGARVVAPATVTGALGEHLPAALEFELTHFEPLDNGECFLSYRRKKTPG